MFELRVVGLAIAFTLFSASCKKRTLTDARQETADLRKKVLVTVGSHAITAGEFIDRLHGLSPYIRARYQSTEAKREFLKQMIEFELLVQEAMRLGLDKSPEAQRLLKQLAVEAMIEDELNSKVKLSDISVQALRAYYESHPDEFYKPEQVRIAHILLRDKKTAETILPSVIAAGHDQDRFEALVKKYSTDESTRLHEGDLNYISRQSTSPESSEAPALPKALVSAAFTLKEIGDVYPHPIEGATGFHIIRLTGRHMPLKLTFDEAQPAIRNRIWRARREAYKAQFIAEIINKAKMTHRP